MKLPFMKPQRHVTDLQFVNLPSFNVSRYTTSGVDITLYVQAFYSDGEVSKLIQVPTIILGADKVREMYAMVAKDQPATEPKPIRRRARRKVCKNGHLKDAENTILVGGHPRCRTCYLDYNEQEKNKRRAAKGARS